MERYAHAIGEEVFNYLAVAVSIEDPGTLVLIMGYPDEETAEFADKVCWINFVRLEFCTNGLVYRVSSILRRRR
ncbi:hypothetical protein DL98DRAFT_518955 [Cadophora sp. DSE1049]|nr:hypothetical protein DL98DRAFT_518955 [Cadophora sp. DSE1049]